MARMAGARLRITPLRLVPEQGGQARSPEIRAGQVILPAEAGTVRLALGGHQVQSVRAPLRVQEVVAEGGSVPRAAQATPRGEASLVGRTPQGPSAGEVVVVMTTTPIRISLPAAVAVAVD